MNPGPNRFLNVMLRHVPACAVVALAPILTAAQLQTSPEAETEAKKLVVMLFCRLGSDSSQGAGIIVGAEAKQLYIVTADHVVRPCRQSGAEVPVALRWQPQQRIIARLLPQADTLIDLAVLVVDDPHAPGAGESLIPFDRLGLPDSLVRAHRVFSVGYSRGRTWAVNTSFDVFAEAQGNSLFYESNFIGPGMSGGGLFDEEFLVVGMIRSDQPPTGEAVSFTTILRLLRQWRYPVSLRTQSVPSQLAAVVVGGDHMCGLDAAGSAYCWGANDVGMLGTGTRGAHSRRVLGNLTFRSLTAGRGHTCGLTTDQTAYCWGWNFNGSLGTGATEDGIGSTVAQRVAGSMRFASITAGDFHSCGVSVEHSAYCWGGNRSGQLGDGSTSDSRVPVPVSGNLSFAELSPASDFTCAITMAGAAYCWGLNLNNQFGGDTVRESPTPIAVRGSVRLVSIRSSGSSHHTCGLTSEGAAFCWGWNHRGQLGNGAMYDDSLQAPTPVAGGLRFRSLSVGVEHTCGVTLDGRAYCWGRNKEGQLGSGDLSDASVPVPVAGDLRWSSLSARVSLTFEHSLTCGLTVARALYCWGTSGAPGDVDHAFPLSRPVTRPREVHP